MPNCGGPQGNSVFPVESAGRRSSFTSMLNFANSSIKFLQRLLICHTSVAFTANRKMYDIGTPLFFTMSYI
jgi:hypothetical protein